MATVTWITPDDVQAALGTPITGPTDVAWLTQVTDAANAWAYRRRHNAGYSTDTPDIAPDASAKTGTVLYALALWKERGAVESFPSFDGWQAMANVGNLGQIKRLLGIDRPQCA